MDLIMIFRQLFEPGSCALTYLIGCTDSREALVIDPRKSQFTLLLALVAEHQLKLKFILRTHVHQPDTTGIQELCTQTGAECLIGAGNALNTKGLRLCNNEEIQFGSERVIALATPGHTPGCISYVWRDRVFCGDVMEIGGCGQIDDETNLGDMFDSVRNIIFKQPDEMLIFPGHDYAGRTVSTVAEERRNNIAFSGISRDSFISKFYVFNRSTP
jgi:glyoxylase-like metal-dependent hydrolase (beta-lactamase superfamily II)